MLVAYARFTFSILTYRDDALRYNKENILPISDQCSNFIPLKILARKGIIFGSFKLVKGKPAFLYN